MKCPKGRHESSLQGYLMHQDAKFGRKEVKRTHLIFCLCPASKGYNQAVNDRCKGSEVESFRMITLAAACN